MAQEISMGNNSVSVIIPTYNRAYCISNAVESVFQQEGKFVKECIVVDDGSNDNTKSVLSELKTGKYKDRLIVIDNMRGKGPGGARNCGLEVASGDFVAFLDSDDEWAPKHLKKALSVLTTDHHVGFYFADSFSMQMSKEGMEILFDSFLEKKNILLNAKKSNFSDVFYIIEEEVFDLLLLENFVQTQTFVARREVFDKVNFNENVFNGEDWLCWLELSAANTGLKWAFCFFKSCKIIVHQDNLCRTSDFEKLFSRNIAYLWIVEYLMDNQTLDLTKNGKRVLQRRGKRLCYGLCYYSRKIFQPKASFYYLFRSLRYEVDIKFLSELLACLFRCIWPSKKGSVQV